jgi:thiol-disulfide isomerase/thioredoxin
MAMPLSPTTPSLPFSLIASKLAVMAYLKSIIGFITRAAATVLFVFSVACFSALAQTHPEPAFAFNDLTGKSHSLAEYQGKIVILNFWATWCGPCRDEMPMLSKLSKDFAPQDVVFLAVSLDDEKSRPKIPRFLAKKKITLTVFTGATPATLHDFQLGEIVPATIILDRQGQPAFRIMGQASKKDIFARVDWLLSDRSSKSPKPLLKNF